MMKKKFLAFLSCITLTFVVGSCDKSDPVDPPCIDTDLINDNIGCFAIYDPVCGCDGQTYGNACVARNHYGVTSWTPGPCNTTMSCESMNGRSLIRVIGDPMQVDSVYIQGDCLVASVRYSGGCEIHNFELTEIHPFCATPPLPNLWLDLSHEANGDACDALLMKTVSFDLTSIQKAGQSSIVFDFTAGGDPNYSRRMVYHY